MWGAAAALVVVVLSKALLAVNAALSLYSIYAAVQVVHSIRASDEALQAFRDKLSADDDAGEE